MKIKDIIKILNKPIYEIDNTGIILYIYTFVICVGFIFIYMCIWIKIINL